MKTFSFIATLPSGSIVLRVGAGRGGCPLTPMKQQQGTAYRNGSSSKDTFPLINGGSKQQESYTGTFGEGWRGIGEGLNIKNVPLISLFPII